MAPGMVGARQTFGRTIGALDACARGAVWTVAPAAFVLLAPGEAAANAQEYCITSDVQFALATGATAFPRGQIAADREGAGFLASAQSEGRWFAVSKALLTERIARGRDAAIAVPDSVSRILQLTCPALLEARRSP